MLDRFEALTPGPVPFAFDWIGGAHPRHVVFACLVHGDEVGPLAGVLQVIQDLREGRLHFGGRATFLVGNPRAARLGQRFVQADLNRVFLDGVAPSYESQRADLLRPILDGCELFVDLHQTALQSRHPFYTLPWSPEWARWCRVLAAAPVWVTRPQGVSFAKGVRCADEYVRDGGAAGITVELGQKGLTELAEKGAADAIRRALAAVDAMAQGESLEQLAREQPEPRYLVTAHKLPFSAPELALRDGFVNFQPVKRGERLSAEGSPALICPEDGLLVFPKYPDRVNGLAVQPRPRDIAHVVQKLQQHPSVAFGG